jgi:hypothetical protein
MGARKTEIRRVQRSEAVTSVARAVAVVMFAAHAEGWSYPITVHSVQVSDEHFDIEVSYAGSASR